MFIKVGEIRKHAWAAVAMYVERVPTVLASSGSSPFKAEILSVVNRVPFYIAFHYLPLFILIWLKYSLKGRKLESQPSISPKHSNPYVFIIRL